MSGRLGLFILYLGFGLDGRRLFVGGSRGGWWVDPASGADEVDRALASFGPAAFSEDGRTAVNWRSSGRANIATVACTRHGPGGWAEAWQTTIRRRRSITGVGLLVGPIGDRVVLGYVPRPGPGKGEVKQGLVSFEGPTGQELGEWVGRLPRFYTRHRLGPGGVHALIRDRALFVVPVDVPDARPVKRLNPSGKHFTDAAFSPDGRWLATTSNDALVTLWDVATWQVARQYEWGIGRLRPVAFSPDGTLCAAGSDTGRVVVWDFDG